MTPISELPLPPTTMELATTIRLTEDRLQREIEERASRSGWSKVTLMQVRFDYLPRRMTWRMDGNFWSLFYDAKLADFVGGIESDSVVYEVTVTTCDPEATNPSIVSY